MDNGNNGRKYSSEQVDVLNRTSMRDILAVLGYNTAHTPGGLFFSPFRPDSNPSFHIDDANHRWYDHGDGTLGSELKRGSSRGGGDPILLVRLLRKCSFREACDFLASLNPSVIPHVEDRIITTNQGGTGGECVDTSVERIHDGVVSKSLRDYAVHERCIPAAILDRYVHQVDYVLTFADRQSGEMRRAHYFAIGNVTVGGGWNLRYPSKEKRLGKRAVKGEGEELYSVYDATGREYGIDRGEDGRFVAPKAESGNVVVFEGVMDFMSWMAWTERTVPGDTDVVVLNSTNRAPSALGYICSHANVVCYLDNDGPGDKATDLIAEECDRLKDTGRNIRFFDLRKSLHGRGDVNEAWQEVCRRRERKALDENMVREQRRREQTRATARDITRQETPSAGTMKR